MSRLVIKPTKWHVRPAKTLISLGICPVWSESSLSAWRKRGSLATQWAHSEDSDQTGWMPRLIWFFAGRTVISLVLSCRGSNFVWSISEMGKSNFYSNVTKNAIMSIYVKIDWKPSSQNQQANDGRTLFTALETWALQSVYKWWSWIDLHFLYGKVNFAPLCFWYTALGRWPYKMCSNDDLAFTLTFFTARLTMLLNASECENV